MQKVVWTASETVSIADALDKAGFRDTLYKIAGTEEIQDDTHSVRRQSLEASNADKETAVDDILKAYDAKDLEKFYFEYHLQKHHRIRMQGAINPQQSHVSRYYVRPFESVEYNSDNLWLFKISVVAGLGFKVDKNDLDAAIKEFDRILTDPEISRTVLAAVDAINRIEEKGQAARLAKLLPLVQ